MVVAFLVRCSLFFLWSLSKPGHGGDFGDYMSGFVGGRCFKAFGLASVVEWSVRLHLRYESNWLVVAVLSLPALMSQCNRMSICYFFFLFPTYGLSGLVFCTFLLY